MDEEPEGTGRSTPIFRTVLVAVPHPPGAEKFIR
jgi:hypothetical protein